ncbi:SufE family protein [Pararhizobium mangrovi]|uniref:SufE family protein n=1 Tax=Pararhizobium mangrovi TaxID=2590452 RepID=A0A506UHD1_9HYPH|nr:SufE family protein [Pararhizobium mangrovi]TPW32726.1 SufE family protein [Pararhizobium mangrovi]
MADIDTIIEDFEFLDDWEDRYRYVIELGKALPDMPEGDRTEANKVQGCVSQVWLVHEETGAGTDPVMVFRGDSDAHIVRGLVAITLSAVDGKRASEIEAFDAVDLFSRIGLIEHLTPQRANGLRAMIGRIKAEAAVASAA